MKKLLAVLILAASTSLLQADCCNSCNSCCGGGYTYDGCGSCYDQSCGSCCPQSCGSCCEQSCGSCNTCNPCPCQWTTGSGAYQPPSSCPQQCPQQGQQQQMQTQQPMPSRQMQPQQQMPTQQPQQRAFNY